MKKHTLLTILTTSTWAPGFTISLDYSFNNDPNGFFSNPVAIAAIDKAAADISAVILGSLSAVDQNSITEGSGGDQITIGGNRFYANPTTGDSLQRDFATDPIPADTYVIYVGSRSLGGNTAGQGGFSSGVNGGSFSSGLTQSGLDAATAAYTAEYGRGGGPTMSSFEITANGFTSTVSNGPIQGHLWFDHDTNNDNVTDTPEELGMSWHFDHTVSVGPGLNDLYSVALHEILHAIGFGGSETWDSLISGTNYLGPEGILLNGNSGTGLVDGGGGHLAPNTMSASIVDGSPQEVAMDPSLTTGTRKNLTQLDLAVLRDMGYEAIPEPTTGLLIGLSLLLLCGHRRK